MNSRTENAGFAASRMPSLIWSKGHILLWVLIALYAAYVVVSSLTTWLPLSASSWLFMPVFNLLVIVHALQVWRVLDVVVFYVLVFVVSTAIENIGVLTGVPFGEYYYTDILGPKLGVVPIAIGLIYVPSAYICWTVATIVLNRWKQPLSTRGAIAVALFASICMVLWDLSLDPLNSTVGGSWIWVDGGAYFGVPIVNFVGWFVTVMVFFVPFAFYLRSAQRRTAAVSMPRADNRMLWIQAAVVYFLMGLSRVLMAPGFPHTSITDGGGTVWDAAFILQATGLISVFTVWVVALLALMNVLRRPQGRD